MSNKLVYALAAALGLWTVGSASAADLPVKARPYVPPVPVFSWTGLYIGGHVGGAWGTTETSIVDGSSIPWSSRTSNGFLGGGQIGLNYQIGWAVIGVEGAGSWADIRGDAPCGFFNFFACSTHSKSIVNVTGRIGALMMERTLVYVKGGVAWKDTDYSGHFTLIPGADVFNASSVRTGALFGAGAEYAFAQNWTAFIEYNYMDFRTKRLTYTAADGDTAIFDNNDKLHLVKAGLNYRFNWPFFHY